MVLGEETGRVVYGRGWWTFLLKPEFVRQGMAMVMGIGGLERKGLVIMG